jgi:hypothetical protein
LGLGLGLGGGLLSCHIPMQYVHLFRNGRAGREEGLH